MNRIIVFLNLLILITFTQARADDTASALTLKDALTRALKYNPRLAAAQATSNAAGALARQSRLFPNPEAEWEKENFGKDLGDDQDEKTVVLSQLVPLGGDRAAQIRMADQDQQAALWNYETVKLLTFRF